MKKVLSIVLALSLVLWVSAHLINDKIPLGGVLLGEVTL